MTFNPSTQLDPGQVTDRRGMGRGGGLALGGGGAIGRRPAPRLRPARRQPERSRADPRAGRRDRPGELRARHRLQDRPGRQRARRLPDPRLRQQHPGVLDRRVRGVGRDRTSRPTPSCSPARPRAAAGPRARRPARSTARATSSSTSTSTSSTSCARASARRAARSPRATSSPTSTATTSRTCSALSGRGGGEPAPRAARSGSSCRPTASPASGRNHAASTGFLAAVHRCRRSPMRSTPRRRSATTGSRSRRRARSTPTPGRTARPSSARQWFMTGYQSGDPSELRHVQRRRSDPAASRRIAEHDTFWHE